MEVVTGENCYIKGDKSNTEMNEQDVKECVHKVEGSCHYKNSNYTSLIKDKISFKRVSNTTESFTPLGTRCEQIWRKVSHLHNIPMSPTLKEDVVYPEPGRWCKFP